MKLLQNGLLLAILVVLSSYAQADVLSNGQSIVINGNSGSTQFHSVSVPAGASDLEIKISGGSGDADLYTRFGSQPTYSNYDCRPYRYGNDETCTVAVPAEGTYYIMLDAYSAYSNVTLSVSYVEEAAQPQEEELENGQSIVVNGGSGSTQFYSINVPTGASNLVIEISGGSGDADLYTRFGSKPTSSSYDCRPYRSGNNETCSVSSPNVGIYYIMLDGYSAYSNVSLTASYDDGSTPPPPPSGSTIDVVTYNIEWLGNPSTAGYNGSRSQQINAAANDIINGGGEIYALQEIGGSSTLNDLVTALNSNDSVDNWSGDVSQPSASQSLAFVYKTSVVTSASFQTILTNASSYDFAGRYPYLMTATVSVDGHTKSLNLVNLHLKCCTGSSESNRRANAMTTLANELHNNYRTYNVIVLGDLNVASEGGANGEIADWGIYNDRDNDGYADYSHAAGSVQDKPYVPSNPDSDIDHILISDELKASWDAISASVRNEYLTTTVSDHSPVKTTLDVALFGTATNPTPDPDPNPNPSENSVLDALAANVGTSLTAVGVIVEGYNGIYALRMRDETYSDQTIIVKLESSQRSTWSPQQNPSVVGKTIRVVGKRDTYSNLPSIENVTSIQEVTN
ncbi:MAG: hypothetical protein D6B28_07780 [Gammaproteobacteria bacterium]|nr:MAG: hypothetical protein D6B28_07780 [Gammaproteobacteria bacterium]